MTKKLIFFMVILIVSAASVSASGQQEQSPEPETVETTEQSGGSLFIKKGYELAMLSGKTLSDVAYGPNLLKEAEVTMINVWTTTCPYCIEEMPMLEELSKEIASEGVQIIGIIGDGAYNSSQAQAIIDRTGVEYVNIIPDKSFMKTIMEIAYAVPTTIYVDKDGRILGEPVLGARSKEYYTEQARNALNSL